MVGECHWQSGDIKADRWYDAQMTLSRQSLLDLQWLLDNLREISAPVIQCKTNFTIFTDARGGGGGGGGKCFDLQHDLKTGGQWSVEEKTYHINYLELKGIFFGLKCICSNKSLTHIQTMTDNTTAVACINKQGSVKSRMCNEISRGIWEFAMRQNMWLSAAHYPGVKNTGKWGFSYLWRSNWVDNQEWPLQENLRNIWGAWDIFICVKA